jgi:hypothetical protein
MPNWCNNTITISGQTETIKNLWEEATAEDGGLLSAMVPQPRDMFHGNLGEKERAECAEKGIPNWYDWQVSNWGTKWDVSTEGLEFTDNGDGTASIEGWFDSAWAPPIGAYEKFCDDMDGVYLEAYYEEGGMDFAGHWTSEGDDDYLEGISDYAREKIKTGESGSSLYDFLDDYFEITENRREYIEEELEEESAN